MRIPCQPQPCCVEATHRTSRDESLDRGGTRLTKVPCRLSQTIPFRVEGVGGFEALGESAPAPVAVPRAPDRRRMFERDRRSARVVLRERPRQCLRPRDARLAGRTRVLRERGASGLPPAPIRHARREYHRQRHEQHCGAQGRAAGQETEGELSPADSRPTTIDHRSEGRAAAA